MASKKLLEKDDISTITPSRVIDLWRNFPPHAGTAGMTAFPVVESGRTLSSIEAPQTK